MAKSSKQLARKSAPKRTKSNFRGTIVILTAAACIGVGVYVLANPRPDHSMKPLTVRTSTPGRPPVLAEAKTAPKSGTVSTSSSRRPLAYYTREVPSTLFEQPQPKAPPAPVEAPVTETAPAPVDPFAGWSYTGTIRQGNHMIALIENTSTHEGQYVSEGSWFLGDQVTHISDGSVTITGVGTPHVMAKSQDYKMVPLDKSAPFLSSTATAAPAKPGAPPPPAPGTPANGAPNASALQAMRKKMRSMFRNFRGGRGGFTMQGGALSVQMAAPGG